MTTLLINKAHYPVTVLGPGRRIGIWTQGCRVRCAGCVSQDTWEIEGAGEVEIDRLVVWCESKTEEGVGGISITGGEPFDQPEALGALLGRLIAWRDKSGAQFDILVYSGYPLEKLQSDHAAILTKIDLLIPEPFITGQPQTHVWRGSANQPLVPLTDLGRERYTQYMEMPSEKLKSMQLMFEAGKIWYIGIPGRGDMESLERLCKLSGIEMENVSWRM